MKKILYVLCFFAFTFFFNIVTTHAFEYYDKDSNVLINTYRRVTYQASTKEGYAGIYKSELFYFQIAKYSDEVALEQEGITRDNIGCEPVYKNGTAKSKVVKDNEKYVVKIATYDDDYFYVYVFNYKGEIDPNVFLEECNDIVINSKYQYKSKEELAEDNNGNVYRKEINISSGSNGIRKSNIIRLVGTFGIILISIIIIIKRKFKLNNKNYIGVIGVVYQIYRLFINSVFFVSGNRVEELYVLLYFLPGLVGLFLIMQENNIVNNDINK